MKRHGWLGLGLLVFGLSGACSSKIIDSTDGNTSWLFRCATDRDCEEGLSCICGVCTVECASDSVCASLEDATCLDEANAGCTSAVSAGGICTRACARASDCPSADHTCASGACVLRERTTASPAVDGGDAGGSGADAASTTCRAGGEPCQRFGQCCSQTCTQGTCAPATTTGPDSAPPPDPCGSLGVPPPPAGTRPGEDITFSAVIRRADLGDSTPNPGMPPERYLEIGYNLDQVCTAEDDLDNGECRLPSWASGVADGEGGIDNSFGAIMQSIRNTMSGLSSENYTEQLEMGWPSVLFRVSGYNGGPNDNEVRVDALPTGWFDRPPPEPVPDGSLPDGGAAGADASPGAGDADAPAPRRTPAWDGTDAWPIAEDALDGGNLTDPRYRDAFGYVRDGTLVARFAALSWRLSLRLSSSTNIELDVLLTGAVLTCDVNESPAGYALTSCVLAGRWSADGLLQQLSQFPDPAGQTGAAPLCADSPLYLTFKNVVCSAIDTFSGLPDLASVCDTMSFGMVFETFPARVGDVVTVAPLAPRCPNDTEPSNDTCSSLADP